jgi:methionyl-tRNA formyltransferase
MKITLSTNGLLGINAINKLFSLGYQPHDIQVWFSEDAKLLVNFCNTYQIDTLKISGYKDFPKLTNNDLLLSMFGTPLLIPSSVIDQFTFGGINLHPADTEKYRGRWMVSWCLINNESSVAYTWHRMNNQYDTGNILLKHSFGIGPKDTAFSLNLRILDHAVANLEKILDLVTQPGCVPKIIGRYYNKQMPFDGMINPNWNPDQIDRFIRAMYHPPYNPACLIKNGKTYFFNTIDEFQYQKPLLDVND